MNKIKIALFSVVAIMVSCSDSDEQVNQTTVSADDFFIVINENPTENQSLGTIEATTNQGGLTYSITEISPSGAFQVNSATGEITVADAGLFDYEVNPIITGIVKVANGDVFDTAFVTINLNNVDDLTLQERLDNGETPFEIYQSNTSLLTSLYGLNYQGGIICHLDTADGSGIIAASADQSAGIQWGCMGTNISGAENAGMFSGESNTNAIVAGCADLNYAAKLCHNLYLNTFNDWVLPSKDELNLLYTNLHANGLGNFGNGWYWSSTEFEDQANFNDLGYEAAWVQSFMAGDNGLQVTYDIGIKNFENRVRAVRYY